MTKEGRSLGVGLGICSWTRCRNRGLLISSLRAAKPTRCGGGNALMAGAGKRTREACGWLGGWLGGPTGCCCGPARNWVGAFWTISSLILAW